MQDALLDEVLLTFWWQVCMSINLPPAVNSTLRTFLQAKRANTIVLGVSCVGIACVVLSALAIVAERV